MVVIVSVFLVRVFKNVGKDRLQGWETLKLLLIVEWHILKSKEREHGTDFRCYPHVSIIKKPWAMVNCTVNYLHYTYMAFSICLAIYSLCFVFLLPFVVGIPLSIASLVFSLRFWDRGSKQTFGLSFASYVMIWHSCGPRVFLHFALSWVCWELWHLRSDIAKLDKSVGNRAL